MKSEKASNIFYQHIGASGLSGLAVGYRTDDDIKLIKSLCAKSDRILDLACGYGRVAIPIAQAGYDISGVDCAPDMISEARKKAKKMRLKADFARGSMLNIPYPENSFDKIFCFWSGFNHLLTKKDQMKALNETFRLLRPDGFALIDLSNGEAKHEKSLLRREGYGPDKRLTKHHFLGVEVPVYLHSRQSFSDLCKKSKFARFKVEFKNFNRRRRILATLWK